MDAIVNLVLSLLAGALLGLVFFGGLWITIRTGLHTRYPYVWFLVSYMLRLSIVIGGFYVFYVFINDSWIQLLVMLAGFTLMKYIIAGSKMGGRVQEIGTNKEISHEN